VSRKHGAIQSPQAGRRVDLVDFNGTGDSSLQKVRLGLEKLDTEGALHALAQRLG
jgi:hypothetical protein